MSRLWSLKRRTVVESVDSVDEGIDGGDNEVEKDFFSGNFSAMDDVNIDADSSDVDVDAIVTEVEDVMEEINEALGSEDLADSDFDLSDTMTYLPVRNVSNIIDSELAET